MYSDAIMTSCECAPVFQGTHRSLQDSQSAKATVAAIVNGIGSFGSALGPLVIGIIADRVSCEGNQVCMYVPGGSSSVDC